MTSYSDTLTDNVQVVVDDLAILALALDLIIALNDPFIVDTRYSAIAVDNPAFSEALSTNPGAAISEMLQLLDPLGGVGRYGQTSEDTLALATALLAGRPVSVGDTLNLHDALVVLQAAKVIESLGLQDAIGPQLTYGMTVTETMRLADLLRRFFSAQASDGIGVLEELLLKATTLNSVSENLGLSDALDNQMVFRVIASDTIDVQPDQLLHMIFNGQVTDGIEIEALYLAPNNSITTFAINPKKGAVTEYGNYNFNSFALMGHKYLGASSTGLFELNGPDDAGTPIIAHIKGGFMQFGQMHLSSIKGIYLGIRGDGDFLLKIEDGAGHSYTYGLKAKHFETTRVRPGKGLRARFFRFELISTGQDFDLEAIEFLPIVDKRRG